MAIPDFQTFLLPVLELAGDDQVHALAEAREALALKFKLSAEDRVELLPSGRVPRFNNRVAWAKSYLEQARLISSPRRAHFEITERGRQALAQKPGRIDIAFLEKYEEFKEFRNAGRKAAGETPAAETHAEGQSATPEELLDQAYQSIRAELTSSLLNRVKEGSPKFFESLVVELLLKMGYGRSLAEAGRAIGASGDEGIDGIISEDRLGLDEIYIQAKKWEGTVGRPEIQKFVGALHGKRARKGVFITTGSFSGEARDYVSRIDPRVVLIDGKALTEYMIDFNLGVTPKAAYELKRVDTDYFSDE
jgi:restriction system protein